MIFEMDSWGDRVETETIGFFGEGGTLGSCVFYVTSPEVPRPGFTCNGDVIFERNDTSVSRGARGARIERGSHR